MFKTTYILKKYFVTYEMYKFHALILCIYKSNLETPHINTFKYKLPSWNEMINNSVLFQRGLYIYVYQTLVKPTPDIKNIRR